MDREEKLSATIAHRAAERVESPTGEGGIKITPDIAVRKTREPRRA